jgi:hypothetical protein
LSLKKRDYIRTIIIGILGGIALLIVTR